MPTLQELTLKMSRDLSANQQARDAELERLEQERLTALRALAGSTPVLQQFNRAQANAESVRQDSLAEIDAELQAAERKAGSAREAALARADARMKDADSISQKARDDAVARANAVFEADLDRIAKTLPLDAQILARREAQRKRDLAVEAAHQTLQKALQENKNDQLDERQAALDGELGDARKAREEANAARARTEEVFQAALKAAVTRLRLDLATVAGATEVQADFDARRVRVKEDFRRREEQLFAEFAAERKKIEAANV